MMEIEITNEKLAVNVQHSMFSHLVFSCTCNVGSQKVLEERSD